MASQNPGTDALTLFALPVKRAWADAVRGAPMLSGMATLAFVLLAATEYPLVYAASTHKQRKHVLD